MRSGVLGTVVLILGCGSFAGFVWATRWHFVLHGPLPAGMRAIIALSFAGAVWFAARVVLSGTGPGAPAAIVLMSVGLVLFIWAVKATRTHRLPIAFAGDQPAFIYRSGPFRYVRHPFYLSYILCWVATSLATRGAWSWVVPLVMGAIYFAVARQEEQKFSASSLSGSYDAYRKATAMFIPGLRRRGTLSGRG